MENIFEQGPIRPPSEAASLLVRLTRNCPWNKCAFCHTYKGTKFELRKVEEIKADIQVMKDYADKIIELSWKVGEGGAVNRNVLREVYNLYGYNDFLQNIAAWLYFGGENVFLQDANSLIMKTNDLVEILNYLKEKFPKISRITSYCRSHTAARKTVDDFVKLKTAGLTRIHVGMESGSDAVLQMVRKGTSAEEHIRAGINIRQSGIELSEYFMPGLGGRKLSKENAVESAKVLNAVNPDFIRLRTLHVVPGTEMEDLAKQGGFETMTDDEIIKEIQLFIQNLELDKTRLVSDHILNLLEELEGQFPQDKAKILSITDKYFALTDKDRLIFRLGRRSGALRRLDDLNERDTYRRLKEVVDNYTAQGRDVDEDMVKIMNSYI
ncbi:MAG TPA: radical SAM protein [Smithellaceae bacterium]|nr:radical SAM protein [Smithellaceae bacterium]HRV26869.1 radical SAM protein [Smithellaceae bacterium]